VEITSVSAVSRMEVEVVVVLCVTVAVAMDLRLRTRTSFAFGSRGLVEGRGGRRSSESGSLSDEDLEAVDMGRTAVAKNERYSRLLADWDVLFVLVKSSHVLVVKPEYG